MWWCLAESAREECRDWLRGQANMDVGIMTDARGHCLLVRFRACNDRLELRSGCLGVVESVGGAEELASSTQKCVKQYFTRGIGALSGSSRQLGVWDEQLQAHFCEQVTSQTADGAPYAQAACRKLAAGIFPRTMAIARDRSHAIVGATKNTASADELLVRFKEEFISGKDSFAKEATHCAEFKQKVEHACAAQQEVAKAAGLSSIPVLAGLRYGKARFQTQVDPERRFLLQLLGMKKALEHRAIDTKVTPAKRQWARSKLQALSFDVVAVVAAFCDGSEHCLDFVRQVEAESRHDPALFALQIHEFLEKLLLGFAWQMSHMLLFCVRSRWD
ncbi:unnamed protein product [Durusdinium trenchii]|uniref:Uncharacterized protein n=1 Tax=Durusdinium trenchii TaxID=1381693 RepID=A0ABP0M8Z2_9DINO